MRSFLLFSALVIFPQIVAAQESFLDGEEVEVVKKSSHSTAIPFEDPRAFTTSNESGQSVENILVGFRFYNPKDNLLPGAGTDDSLPNCTNSAVRRDEIANDSQDLDLIDLLFYNYDDKDQEARARSWDRPTAPYLPGDLYNPRSIKNSQQLFARWVNLSCLPTRVRRVYNNEGVAILEYREGARAWEKE